MKRGYGYMKSYYERCVEKIATQGAVFNFDYTSEQSGVTGYIVGTSKTTDDETFFCQMKLNPSEDGVVDCMKSFLISNHSVQNKTIAIDYRLLTKDIVKLLEEMYWQGYITGIRLLPAGKLLTKDIVSKFQSPWFSGFLLAADNVASNVSSNMFGLDIRNQKGLVRIEHIIYSDAEGKRNNHENIHIIRELSRQELLEVVQLIHKHHYDNIFVDFYDPSYYELLLRNLRELGLREDIQFHFLGNPLYDIDVCFQKLNQFSNNIVIHYNTCNDLNQFYRAEPYTEGVQYYSDIEASGTTDLHTYQEMISMIDQIVEHMDTMGYSPLEKICYVYDYFKQHFIYDPDYETREHAVNANLDKVFNKDRMVCEGFSNLFSAILRRAGLLCFTYGTDDHQKNILRIQDKKYGIDNLAICDITHDLAGPLDETKPTERSQNEFGNFLVPLDYYLYDLYPEVINIPSAFYLTQETYNSYIDNSNPLYATDPLGYGIRMLELMGLFPDRKMRDFEEYAEFCRNALAHSSLTDRISSDVLRSAILHVRDKEGRYSNPFDRIIDKTVIRYGFLSQHGKEYSPCIKLLDGQKMPVSLRQSNRREMFQNLASQNKVLCRPRKSYLGETSEQYWKYLRNFYFQTFVGSDVSFDIEQEKVVASKPKIKIVNPSPVVGQQKKKKRVPYVPMTDDEIREAQEKLKLTEPRQNQNDKVYKKI